MNVQTLFGKTAQSYDQTRKQLVPCFDDLYGTALALIPYSPEGEFQVLDLGAGTGLLAALVAEAFPKASLTLADISPEMLAQAERRFLPQPNQVTTHIIDFVTDSIPGSYDLIVSALALHHTPQVHLPAVFGKIRAALQPGGLFINIDQILGATPEIEAHYQQHWLQQIRENGCTEATIAMALERMTADRTATLSQQLGWLKGAGFQPVNCWYKNYRFAVYSGIS